MNRDAGTWAYSADFSPAARITIRGVMAVVAFVILLVLLDG